MGSPANGSAHLRGVGVEWSGVEWEGHGTDGRRGRGNAERVRVACPVTLMAGKDGMGWDGKRNGTLRARNEMRHSRNQNRQRSVTL